MKKGHYKTIHSGFSKRRGKDMTEGDVIERIGCIRVQVFKWDDEIIIGVRQLKEILGRCRFYMCENDIRKIASEGQLIGKKLGSQWYFSKKNLLKWIRYLERIGLELLIKRGIIKEETIKNTSELIGRENDA